MDSGYNIHLCTFMGREYNVRMLIRYVEEALNIDAIDHYWMFDMTRNHDDHEYIHQLQQQLNEKFPGRVHLVNRDIRREQLDAGLARDTIGQWGTFYKYLTNFDDNDVIIKCDDDTLYFDVETIRAAAELRWNNPSPLLMHANTINNGMAAYHQQQQDIWKFKHADVLKKYPTSGLTGPLFSHPIHACECHKQFAADILEDESNVNKYKLHHNPYFCARVSINMIFMLGKDRHMLSTIDSQDEYITSSKLGQQLDRPNMLIGDFVSVHHTYGVQEPVMEEIGTHEIYQQMTDKIFSNNTQRVNRPITTQMGTATVLKNHQEDVYLACYWATPNSVTLKNARTDKYINVDWTAQERVKVTKDPDTGDLHREGLGIFWYKTDLNHSDEPLIFNMDFETPGPLQIQECTEILKCFHPDNNGRAKRFMAFPVKMWFQKNYTVQHVQPIINDDGTYKLESVNHPRYYLIEDDRNPNNVNYFFEYENEESWHVEKMDHLNNKLVPIKLDRGNQDECENDPTTATVTNDPDLPKCRNYREFYWMVDKYIWEIIDQSDDTVFVKLIADDKPDLYLTADVDGKVTLGSSDKWTIEGKTLRHVDTGLYLNLTKSGINLTNDPGTNLL